jgi:SAM-dependent methyltransferase
VNIPAQQPEGITVLQRVHGRMVFERRVRVLAELLAAKIPAGSSVLDIGCGDGSIARRIADRNSSLTIQGIEFAPRPNCAIDCKPFDGRSIPFPNESFDLCMFVDVLHHIPDSSGIERLLLEARRVSKRFVLIKDHLSENWMDFKTLQLMDWFGNRPHGVVLPYNYLSRSQWVQLFEAAGLMRMDLQTKIPIYPAPFSALFGRELHFIELLEKS